MQQASPFLAAVEEAHHHSQTVRLPSYSVHMDAVRSLAAFVVLAGHARMLFFGNHEDLRQGGPGTLQGGVTAPQHLGLGHHAVIVFFVLSGFLVGNSAWRAVQAGRWSWRKYLSQRMTRLWVVLLPALVVGGCLDVIGIRYLSHHQSIYTAPSGQGMVVSGFVTTVTVPTFLGNLAFLQTIKVPNFGSNAALWSLANEFWYYMAFPPLLLFFARRQPVWLRVVWLALAAGILGFVGFQIAALFPIWLLGFGVSVMPLLLQRQHHAISASLGLLQFALVNGFLRVHPVKTLYADTLLGLSFSFLLYCLVHLRTPVGSLLYQRIATGFSRFSYTLYVSHLPFLTFVTAVLITPWHPWRKDAPHLLAAVLVVCVTYGYSFGLYLLFESNTDRVRRWINERLPEQHGRSTSIAAENKEGRKIVG